MHGDADATGVVHDVDVLVLQRRVQLRAARMLEGEDAGAVPAAHRLHAELAQARFRLGHERIGVRGDVRHADAFQIAQRGIERVERDEVRHPHGEARRAGLRHRALEAIGIEGILQMQPAARVRREPRGAAPRECR